MDFLLKPEFWTGQVAVALQAWAIVVPLFILAFLAGWKFKGSNDDAEMRGLRADRQFLADQLQQVREQNVGEAKAIAELQSEVSELRKLVEGKAPLTALEPILKAVQSTAGTLATANSTTHHILRAETGMFVMSGLSADAKVIPAPKNKPSVTLPSE